MRTTIDLPEQLLQRVNKATAKRKTTFRALVIDALEQSLNGRSGKFRLRDASVGTKPRRSKTISSTTIHRAIDSQRKHSYRKCSPY